MPSVLNVQIISFQFVLQIPTLNQQLQKWEEDRWNTLLGFTKTYSSLQEITPTSISDYVTELKNLVSASKIETDFKETLDQISKDVKEEKPLDFVPYGVCFKNGYLKKCLSF